VAKKSTDAEIAIRVRQVYGLLTQGFSRQQVIQYCSENWSITERHADNYIAKARILIDKDCELSRPAFLAEALGRLRNLEQAASRRGQLMVATNAIRLQCELIGLTK
jgi:hypothetical protein